MDEDDPKMDRLRAILTRYLESCLGQSLAEVEDALRRWRAGELGALEAHAAVLAHAGRAQRLAGRLAGVDEDGAAPLLRDAVDRGMLSADEFRDLVGCEPDTVEPAQPFAEPPPSPGKRELVERLIGDGPVLIHLDPRRDGVSVPVRLACGPRLVLRFGYDLKPAIHDLQIGEGGLSGTLTFGGVPHHCVLPWDAVFAVVAEDTGKGMVWAEDVPAEVVAEMRDAGDKKEEPAKKGSHLKLVD
ncbi:MAG TPA: ClpXP protease specificity-enhancing factor SspB [Kofleriaceae bacterium]|nr:ClpXP protease specificity-enhancing factor SspB [Kofleriaceae bacterium]